METLDKDQLKERLLVAETLLKKLYNRNKELETFIAAKAPSSEPNQTLPSIESNDIQLPEQKGSSQQEEYQKLVEEFKKREDQLLKDLEDKQKELEKAQSLIMERTGKETGAYTTLLEERLVEC